MSSHQKRASSFRVISSPLCTCVTGGRRRVTSPPTKDWSMHHRETASVVLHQSDSSLLCKRKLVVASGQGEGSMLPRQEGAHALTHQEADNRGV